MGNAILRVKIIKWSLLFIGFFLFNLNPLYAASWTVNVGTGTKYFTQTSLNSADVGTNNITIGQGDTITWNFVDTSAHTVNSSTGTADGACSAGVAFASGTLTSSDTFLSPVFNNLTPAGNPCKYYCTAHAAPNSTSGMIGFITVIPPPPPTLAVTLGGTGSGNITSSPAGIDCGATCSSTFTSGTSVTLSATPATGSTFAGFTGGCVSSSTTCTVTITSNLSVTAKFSGPGGGSGDFETTGFFDADSTPDLVVASSSTKKIKLYPMTSGGSFVGGNPPAASFTMTDPNTPLALATGSFNTNTDAFDDIVLLQTDADGASLLTFYYGNHAGSFPMDATGIGIPSKQLMVPKSPGPTGETLTAVEARDVNGDGKTDLIVTIAPSASGNDPTPRILLGNGDGTFSGTSQYYSGPVLTSITVTPASAAIVVGQPVQFTAAPLDQYGLAMTGITFTWSSSDAAVCSVDSAGLAKGVGAGGPITITAVSGTVSGTAACTVSPPTADVTSTSISTSLSGNKVYISSIIKNVGSSILDYVDVGFYLSIDTIAGNSDDIYIGKRSVTSLAVGATSTSTVNFVLPKASTDYYHVFMYADYNNKNYETNEFNNTLVETKTYFIGSDLKTSSLSGSIVGSKIYVSDAEYNIGNQTAGAFDVTYYLSQGTTPNPATDPLIGSRSISSLAALDSNTSTVNFTIPVTASVGIYYLCAISDSGGAVSEIDETNNNFCTSTTFIVGPDLKNNGISGSISGVKTYISDTISNIGDQPAGGFSVSYYFSSTSPLNTASPGTLITGRILTGLASGGNNSANVNMPVPSSTPVGSYYLCTLVDSGNGVPETNEDNNTACTLMTYLVGPDVRVYSISASKSGSKLYVSDTEINGGNQSAGGFTVSYYLSTDLVYDGSDVFLGQRSLAGLAGGNATNSQTNNFPIPGSITAGNYYIIGVSDAGNTVNETDETNNTLPTAGTFVLP